MTVLPDVPGPMSQPSEFVLSNAAFDRLVAELAMPAQVVPELVELFLRNPKLPSADR